MASIVVHLFLVVIFCSFFVTFVVEGFYEAVLTKMCKERGLKKESA